MTFTVRPAREGGWHAFVSEPLLLLVEPHDDAFVATAWASIGADNGFQSALDLLTSRGLAATPPFVLIEWAAGQAARIIVRGEVALTVTDASGDQQLTAAGVSTWVERTLPGVTAIMVAVPGATALGTALLPLERGVSVVAGIASEGAEVQVSAQRVAAQAVPVVSAQAAKPAAAPLAAAVPPPAPAVAELPSTLEPDVEATVREAPEIPEAPEPVEIVAPPSETEGYDYLFGDTMYRNVADAAVREPDAEADAEAVADADKTAVVDDTLHDGETVVLSEIARARGRRKPKADSAAAAAAAATTPPAAPPEAAKVVLVISPTGAREPLSQPVLMGRSPSVSKVSAGQVPRLVTIGTVDQDISRNHAQFSLEGGTVVVTDLHSRNGTTIALPGKSAQKLRPGEPTSVIVGTLVDFGGGVTVLVEEQS